VGVALAEYEKGVDSTGRLILPLEYDEAITFLGQARVVASRLNGTGADSARLALDSLTALVRRRVPPHALDGWRAMLLASLGADASLDLPERPVDLALGKRLYAQHCAACHGATAMGDGPAGAGMHPPPPALGSAEAMADVSPSIMYRIVSVGIAGTPMVGWSDQLSVEDRWSIVAWLNGLRAPAAADLATAERVWQQRCASCHGATGESDGPVRSGLPRRPSELSSFAWQAERSDIQIASAIRDGVAGMMPPARDLSPQEVAGVVALVRNLSLGDAPGAAGASNPDSVIRTVVRRLQRAFTSARIGRLEEAEDHAFSAYMEFERIEGRGWWRDPGFVTALEQRFDDFRASLAASDFRRAQRSFAAIEQAMPEMKRLTGSPLTEPQAFWKSLQIILREGVVAILVVGCVFAFLVKAGRSTQLKSVWKTVGLALVASVVTSAVMEYALELLPTTREVVEGVTMLVTVPVLFSFGYTMISMFRAARRPQSIPENLDATPLGGGGKGIYLLVFLAVYSQAAETAFLYQTIHNERSDILKEFFASILIAAVVLPVILALFWRLARRISWRPFFALTSILLFYVSFAFIGKGIRDLHQGGILSLTVLPEWPQLDALGIFPSVETLLLQLTLLVLVFYRVVKTHTISDQRPAISEQQGTSEQHLANSERVTAASVANID